MILVSFITPYDYYPGGVTAAESYVQIGVTSTVHDLAQAISTVINVPALVLRIVWQGRSLRPHENLTALGFSAATVNEVAVLHPNRDERGPVFFKRRDGTTVLRLESGEWNNQTSITVIRPRIADAAKMPSVTMVYDGLTLQDGASFAQCGVHAGGVVTVFPKTS